MQGTGNMRVMVMSAVAAVTLAAGGASAATLTFGDNSEEFPEFVGPSYSEAGLTISAASGSAPVRVGYGFVDQDGLYEGFLGYQDGGPSFEWIISASDRFTLNSIVAAHIDYDVNFGIGDDVVFTGFRDGEAVSSLAVLSEGYYAFSGFTNLDYVTMTMEVEVVGDPRFDDLTWTSDVASVPLPASVTLLGAALAGLGLMRRRRA